LESGLMRTLEASDLQLNAITLHGDVSWGDFMRRGRTEAERLQLAWRPR